MLTFDAVDSIQQMTSIKSTDKCILDVSFCFLDTRYIGTINKQEFFCFILFS